MPKGSLELYTSDIKWSDWAIVWKDRGYCVAAFVKINFFYIFLRIILASFDSTSQRPGSLIWTVEPVLKSFGQTYEDVMAGRADI